MSSMPLSSITINITRTTTHEQLLKEEEPEPEPEPEEEEQEPEPEQYKRWGNEQRAQKRMLKNIEKTKLKNKIKKLQIELLDLEWLLFLDHGKNTKNMSPFEWMLKRTNKR